MFLRCSPGFFFVFNLKFSLVFAFVLLSFHLSLFILPRITLCLSSLPFMSLVTTDFPCIRCEQVNSSNFLMTFEFYSIIPIPLFNPYLTTPCCHLFPFPHTACATSTIIQLYIGRNFEIYFVREKQACEWFIRLRSGSIARKRFFRA